MINTRMDLSAIFLEECISHIISFTSPRNASRSAAVSPLFKSAADSDYVWNRFLPSDYQQIISSSSESSSSALTSLSKKNLYFHLFNDPILINNGTLSFSLDRETGKKCYMIGARGLSIVWGDSGSYWKWPSLPESRFSEVASLRFVWWLEIKGKIDAKILSPNTTYASYFVFKFADTGDHGFTKRSVELSVHLEGTDGEKRRVFLAPSTNIPSYVGKNGWMEIEMGEFFNENGDDGIVVASLFDFDQFTTKGGLIVEGIEFRPKNS